MPLHHNPMARATIAATLLGTTSNIIAQLLQAHNNSRESSSSSSTSTTSSSAKYSLDVIQIVRFAFVVFLTTPPNYLWQALLERLFPAKLNWTNTLTKWFIDCITLGALFNTLAFFILTGLLKNQPLSQIAHTVRTETMPLIVAGYRVWPFASIISFTVVPVEKRVVFLNFVGLLWGVYMSFVAARV
ncbi:uncharacterized protein B0I36DRAFT_282017 [Microdochium trichocladiopsis]|uniref:Mpv17/PMP22 family protein n=1 Tax=Microdochium trichocladiopsis TaxID=1682393 RepID=A0A9P9BX50_9PEZI|nr:uncharacterized protein B0I36DRAFT_282017 [Microdochium trichocladiopsis]KAH7041220.1 hypothetical protein B0I36DRAFT_282017 [Microdochium trichocladiopsis]